MCIAVSYAQPHFYISAFLCKYSHSFVGEAQMLKE